MTSERRVVVFNRQTDADVGLQTLVNGIPGTRVIAEASTVDELFHVLRQQLVGAVIVHLDPKPEETIQELAPITAQFPKLPLIAVSGQTGPTTILNAMRSGYRQFVAKPIDRADLADALDRTIVVRAEQASTGRSVCVTGASGGSGATTIACNLAMEMAAAAGRPVGIVDLHLEFGDVASHFDSHPTHTIASLCATDGEVDRVMLETAVAELPSGVALLGRPKNIEDTQLVTPERVAAIVKAMRGSYAAVVVDTPRTFDHLSISALRQADAVLIVLQLIVPSVNNAIRVYKTLVGSGMPAERVHFVVNRYRKNIGHITPQDLAQRAGVEPFAVVPNDFQCVARALDFGKPLGSDAPNSAVRMAIQDVARRLLNAEEGEVPPPEDAATRRGGLLSRLLRA